MMRPASGGSRLHSDGSRGNGPKLTSSSTGSLSARAGPPPDAEPGSRIPRVSSLVDYRKEKKPLETVQDRDSNTRASVNLPPLFHIIEQLASAENALWNILDGLKARLNEVGGRTEPVPSHASFFCREYWGSSASQAQLSLEKIPMNERVQRQVQQACVLESLSLGVASHLCSGVMQGVSVTARSRLRNLLFYVHENCLVLMDMIAQRWISDFQSHSQSDPAGVNPDFLNFDILVRVKRYRRYRRGEHSTALRQNNELITNVVRQLCRGAAPKRPPLSNRGSLSPGGDRSPGARIGGQSTVLCAVNEVLTARTPLDRLKPSVIRAKMLQHMCFKPLLNIEGGDPDCPWPMEDPYQRYGAEQFAQDGSIIWFEPLPPMLPNLEQVPKLPPLDDPNVYTLVLDLDETLVHYFEHDGMGNYDIRPGMQEFLEHMHSTGYELVIFTAATQDYADWVIDQIDPRRLIHHRLYRQHALPWGPIFVKDLSKLGRDLRRTLIIDNVQENFMLQPNNGIFICTWYDDAQDTALFSLTPLLDELLATRSSVPEILDKYRDQIPTWAGFDFSQMGGDVDDYELEDEPLRPESVPPSSPPSQVPTPAPNMGHHPGLSFPGTGPARPLAQPEAPQAAPKAQPQAPARFALTGVSGPCQAPRPPAGPSGPASHQQPAAAQTQPAANSGLRSTPDSARKAPTPPAPQQHAEKPQPAPVSPPKALPKSQASHAPPQPQQQQHRTVVGQQTPPAAAPTPVLPQRQLQHQAPQPGTTQTTSMHSFQPQHLGQTAQMPQAMPKPHAPVVQQSQPPSWAQALSLPQGTASSHGRPTQVTSGLPTFAGIAGPFQAPPPTVPHAHHQHQQVPHAQQPLPTTATLWRGVLPNHPLPPASQLAPTSPQLGAYPMPQR